MTNVDLIFHLVMVVLDLELLLVLPLLREDRFDEDRLGISS
jgi:hypothetical protein